MRRLIHGLSLLGERDCARAAPVPVRISVAAEASANLPAGTALGSVGAVPEAFNDLRPASPCRSSGGGRRVGSVVSSSASDELSSREHGGGGLWRTHRQPTQNFHNSDTGRPQSEQKRHGLCS